MTGQWPDLPYEAWRDTRVTLHMYLQIVGKTRHALSPVEPDWGHAPLYLTARGVNTSPIPHPAGGVFDIDVDFVEHFVSVRTVDGRAERIKLEPRTVADFYEELMGALERLGVPVEIATNPSDVEHGTPFPEDVAHASYDPAWANRFWLVLTAVGTVLKEHRARFLGRVTPVQLWWGSFDLAYARYSGKDGEHAAAGWWPGDEKTPMPAFYAYTSPKPDGIEAGEHWSDSLGEFLLPYEAVRTSADPRAALLDFLDSTYAAAGFPAALSSE